MKTRPMTAEDVPSIENLISASNLPYPSLSSPLIETVQVVENDNGEIVAAFIAERLVQGYLLMTSMPPHAKLHAIRMLHEAAPTTLKAKGYNGCEAYIPPSLAVKFGRRLERSFKWTQNWRSWNKSF